MREIVFNTGPVIALVAATPSLDWLAQLYSRIWVPHEVEKELSAGGTLAPELTALRSTAVFQICPSLLSIPPGLANELDPGEASVIHTALENRISTVAIDEKTGRRIARLQGLSVTGSLGILVKARQSNLLPSLTDCISRMQAAQIWISESLIAQALSAVDER